MIKRRSVPALLDVARHAGVGAATVSRVINGGQNVSRKMLDRVQKSIDELGYHPSEAARSLKGARTKTIGLIVPSVADPFFAVTAAAVQEVARAHGTLVLLASSDNLPERESEHMVTLIQRRVDGLLLAPSDAADADLLKHAGFPVVCFDRPFPGNAASTVLIDNHGGAKMATEHLLHSGCRRILCLAGDSKLFTSQRRVRGYRDVMKAAGLPYIAELEVNDLEGVRNVLRRHLSGRENVDGIFCIKNALTIHAYKVLREMGVSIPEKVSLLGFDDFDLADTLEPPITVVRQPVVGIATKAAEMLFEAMATYREKRRTVTMNVELVVRGSCREPFLQSRKSSGKKVEPLRKR
ncbi:LacI family DNA-binding transcriptional regulator [Edaphobacter paludis]|uniref:LacI family DNA-binding transcriptional regulator n=1 Tax=Edaphobacter paludis TaxID=3035702 RepID=A0AAU7D821_9BACT